MSNLIELFKKGQKAKNIGLYMGDGLRPLSTHINGIQKESIYVIAGGAKTFKSTFVNYAFVIQPYLEALAKNNLHNLQWIYYSYEMSRIVTEANFSAFFIWNDYKVDKVALPEGIYKEQKKYINISPEYLLGQVVDDNNKFIPIDPKIEELFYKVYENRIIPLFGKYDEKGNKLSEGKIYFVEQRENITGPYKYIKNDFALKRGEYIREDTEYKKIIGYTPYNPDEHVIVIVDHIRLFLKERDMTEKETVDKASQYHCELRNLLKYTFVNIIHTNRDLESIGRLKYAEEEIYPTKDDVKSSGNLGEDANVLITLFDPKNDKYRLEKYFGVNLLDNNGNKLYPNLLSYHLADIRNGQAPMHYLCKVNGYNKSFEEFTKKDLVYGLKKRQMTDGDICKELNITKEELNKLVEQIIKKQKR